MEPKEKEEKDKEAKEKLEGLAEVQRRIMDLEATLKNQKGTESATLRAIASEEIKGLADEVAALKLRLPATPAPAKKEAGFFDELLGGIFGGSDE